jgi:hypothetical protein
VPNNTYRSFPYIYSDRGLVARYAIDRSPQNTFWNHNNAEVRIENSVSTRLGYQPITTAGTTNAPLPGSVQTLARLKGLNNTYRYAGAGTGIYRRTGDTNGAYTPINGSFVLSGNRFFSSPYRPNLSAQPYIFFADSNCMTKDNGQLGTVQQWGIFPPTAPVVSALETFAVTNIFNFQSAPSVISGFTGTSIVSVVNTTIGTAITTAPGTFTVTPASMTNIFTGAQLIVGAETNIIVISKTATKFTAFFQLNHASTDAVTNNGWTGTIAAGSGGTIEGPVVGGLGNLGNGTTDSTDYISLGVMVSAQYGSVFSIAFDVGDGSFTQSYYLATFIDNVPVVPKGPTQPPSPGPPKGSPPGTPPTPPPGPGNPINAAPTGTAWQEVEIPISSFVAIGQAGTPGHVWANVNSWQIVVTNGSPTNTVSVGFNNFYVFGGSGPDSSVGYSYDYRITFYNANTGDESGPSVTQIQGLNPVAQPIFVEWPAAVTPPPPLDPQITHTRVYRRGGTLPNQWLQVAQVPIGTTSIVDVLSDEDIAANNILNYDTAPPVTSALPVPVDTTLRAAVTATGEFSVTVSSTANMYVNQNLTVDPFTTSAEVVIIQAINTGTGTITAYFQYEHQINAIVQATTRTGQPCNISAIAFDQAWVAGDPNNPNILYYSDRFNPESFALENTLEIGVPSDPIMAIVEWNGQLYVFTQNTVWNVLTAAVTGNVPIPYKTAAQHGLNCNFGWVVTEGEIWFQSNGGIYAFQGSESKYVSEPIEWIFTQQFIDDELSRPVPGVSPAQVSQTLMVYYQNEVYISYIDTTATRRRVIWSRIYNRWRNDDIPANAMIVEEDTYKLLFGATTGMIYQDRVNVNYDTSGYAGGFTTYGTLSFNLQTVSLDLGYPKNFKNFNEFTLDIDCGGNTVNVILAFDQATFNLPLGTINSIGRQQITFQVKAGAGYLALDVSVLLECTINSAAGLPVTVYEAHIRAEVEAELRKSADTYVMDFSGPDYKIVKQAWIEYTALDAAGITVNVYVGANTTVSAPNNQVEFSFTLPQSLTRTSKRVRFPATKARVWRWIATSNSDFRLYSDSRIEFNPITKDKGYAALPFQQPEPTQP